MVGLVGRGGGGVLGLGSRLFFAGLLLGGSVDGGLGAVGPCLDVRVSIKVLYMCCSDVMRPTDPDDFAVAEGVGCHI